MKTAPKQENEQRGENRFWAAFAAQIGGLVLLIVLGILVFPTNQPDIEKGLKYIHRTIIIYLCGSAIGFFIPFAIAYFKERPNIFEQSHVDMSIWAYVWMDTAILLFLVCQEGGLCRSMFLPVFLLIPVAYVAVEQHSKRYRSLFILEIIMAYMIISYYMSDLHQLPMTALLPSYLLTLGIFIIMSLELLSETGRLLVVTAIVVISTLLPYALLNTTIMPSFSLPVTDFHTLAHPGFDRALFWASLISVIIPFVQFLVRLYEDRKINSVPAVAK